VATNGKPDGVILQAASAAKLSVKQERAIIALLSTRTVDEAAAQAKVSPRSIRYWLKDAAFQQGYQDERRRAVDRGLARLQGGMGLAVAVLIDAMENGMGTARTRAANFFLTHALRAVEHLDLAAQLKEVHDELAALRQEYRNAGWPWRGAGVNGG
jgi:hypothetical protein